MRRRRLVDAVLFSTLLASVSVAPATAAVPPGPGDHVRPAPSPRPSIGPSPKVEARELQAAPGANGRLAFVGSPFNAFPNGIRSMAANGTDVQQLTPGGSGWGDIWPSYSPGGTMIAFTRDMTPDTTDIDGDIWVMQANGSGLKRLTATTANDFAPVWTPDGSRIVFVSSRTGAGDIYSMKIDGTDVRRLTTSAAFDGSPSVSPDGKRIAFSSDRAGDEEDVYVMNADGSAVVRLTAATGADYAPDWSPDGTKIAFTSVRDGDYEIYVMLADGSVETNLTDDPDVDDLESSWAPDGTQIAFWSWLDTGADIYVMSATGGVQTPVGATGDDEWAPDWQPIPAFPLVDARFSTFEDDIEWVFNEGITVGCSAERYCPTDAVTRGQMATFLVRALDLPATTTDYFDDDTGTTHEANINRVAAAGITSGCGTRLYCPSAIVSRGQMASFLARAFALPATSTDYFTDDNGTTHEANINRVAAAGITSGCTPTTYCPSADVTRGQMAAFLRRALTN